MNEFAALPKGSVALKGIHLKYASFPKAARLTDCRLLNHKRSKFYFLSPDLVACVHALLIGFFCASA